MDIFDALGMLKSLLWAITHPIQFLKRTAASVGGALVGCLAMGIVILAALLISGALGFTGQGATYLMWGALVLSVVVAILVVRWYLRRIPASWRSSDATEEAMSNASHPAAPPTFSAKRTPSLSELDARLAPSQSEPIDPQN